MAQHNLNGRIVEAVTVDFWSTIALDRNHQDRRNYRQKLLSSFLEERGVRAEEVQLSEALAAFSTHWHETWLSARRTLTAMDQATDLLKTFAPGADRRTVQQLARLMDDALLEMPPEPMLGVQEALAELAEHFSMALICDTGISGGANIDRLLERWGLLEFLPHRVYSEQMGVSKPHAAMFLRASELLGVPQQRIVHIGDLDQTDILGAKSIGMAAIRFDGAREAVDCKTCSMADRVVSRWGEVMELLLQGSAEESEGVRVRY